MPRLRTLLDARPRLVLMPFALAVLVILLAPLPNRAQAEIHHLTLDANQFEFAPGRVTVSQGDRIVVTLNSSDVVHGFYLDGYGLEQRVEPGITRQIEFVANRAGKFRYRCSVSCGPLHPFMIGELVVKGNTPYWRAIGLVTVTATGMLAFLWQTGKNTTFQEMINGTR